MTWIQPFEVTLTLAIVLLIAEMFAGAFVFVSISAALFIVSIVQFILHNFSPYRDASIFIVVTVVSFLGLRLTFKAKGDTKACKGDVNEY